MNETGPDKDLLMRYVSAGIATLLVLGFFALGAMLLFVAVPSGNKEMFLQYSGALILAFGGLMQFLFNRSNSEAQNRNTASVAAAAAAAVTPTTTTTVVLPPAPPSPPAEPPTEPAKL